MMGTSSERMKNQCELGAMAMKLAFGFKKRAAKVAVQLDDADEPPAPPPPKRPHVESSSPPPRPPTAQPHSAGVGSSLATSPCCADPPTTGVSHRSA